MLHAAATAYWASRRQPHPTSHGSMSTVPSRPPCRSSPPAARRKRSRVSKWYAQSRQRTTSQPAAAAAAPDGRSVAEPVWISMSPASAAAGRRSRSRSRAASACSAESSIATTRRTSNSEAHSSHWSPKPTPQSSTTSPGRRPTAAPSRRASARQASEKVGCGQRPRLHQVDASTSAPLSAERSRLSSSGAARYAADDAILLHVLCMADGRCCRQR
eukprot:3653654-Prymnesium_polylepis.1